MRASITLLLAILAYAQFASTEEVISDYGDVFIEQERVDYKENRWNISSSYGMVTNNPLLEIQNFSLSMTYRFHLNFQAGLGSRYNLSKVSETASSLNLILGPNKYKLAANYPKMQYFVVLESIPFIGHLNFFGIKSLLTQFIVGADIGLTKVDQKQSLFLAPQVKYLAELYKGFSLGLGVRQLFFAEGGQSFTETFMEVSKRF